MTPLVPASNIISINEIQAVARMNIDPENLELLAGQLESELMEMYGPLLTGDALRKSLGYPSMAALRQAVARGKAPVPMFKLKDRRGKFALAKDVAYWLAEQRISVCSQV